MFARSKENANYSYIYCSKRIVGSANSEGSLYPTSHLKMSKYFIVPAQCISTTYASPSCDYSNFVYDGHKLVRLFLAHIAPSIQKKRGGYVGEGASLNTSSSHPCPNAHLFHLCIILLPLIQEWWNQTDALLLITERYEITTCM